MTTTPARDALRNVICAQAASDTDAEAKLDAHAAEVRAAAFDEAADAMTTARIPYLTPTGRDLVAEYLRGMAATARPDNTTGA